MSERTGRTVFSGASAALITRPEDDHALRIHHARSGHWLLPGGKQEWDAGTGAELNRLCGMGERLR